MITSDWYHKNKQILAMINRLIIIVSCYTNLPSCLYNAVKSIIYTQNVYIRICESITSRYCTIFDYNNNNNNRLDY